VWVVTGGWEGRAGPWAHHCARLQRREAGATEAEDLESRGPKAKYSSHFQGEDMVRSVVCCKMESKTEDGPQEWAEQSVHLQGTWERGREDKLGSRN
jgi:hypothetical protein